MTTLTFEPETHEYRIGEQVVPGVTTILRPAIGYFGTRDEQAAARGEAVHWGCEMVDAGEPADVDPDYEGYIEAYRQFLRETGAVVEAFEMRVFHSGWMYAGTLDRLVRWQDERCLLDLKTGTIAPWMGMQAVAYGKALKDMNRVQQSPACFALQLQENGKYRLHEYKDREAHWDGFLGLLRYYRWRERFT